jgi:hypothetical protein
VDKTLLSLQSHPPHDVTPQDFVASIIASFDDMRPQRRHQ